MSDEEQILNFNYSFLKMEGKPIATTKQPFLNCLENSETWLNGDISEIFLEILKKETTESVEWELVWKKLNLKIDTDSIILLRKLEPLRKKN